jgi:hypothetical protein
VGIGGGVLVGVMGVEVGKEVGVAIVTVVEGEGVPSGTVVGEGGGSVVAIVGVEEASSVMITCSVGVGGAGLGG